VTAAAIAAAKKAAEAGDFDKAVASSNEAEALQRRRSSRHQRKTLWKDMEIR